jgi:hypothetical protein
MSGTASSLNVLAFVPARDGSALLSTGDVVVDIVRSDQYSQALGLSICFRLQSPVS